VSPDGGETGSGGLEGGDGGDVEDALGWEDLRAETERPEPNGEGGALVVLGGERDVGGGDRLPDEGDEGEREGVQNRNVTERGIDDAAETRALPRQHRLKRDRSRAELRLAPSSFFRERYARERARRRQREGDADESRVHGRRRPAAARQRRDVLRRPLHHQPRAERRVRRPGDRVRVPRVRFRPHASPRARRRHHGPSSGVLIRAPIERRRGRGVRFARRARVDARPRPRPVDG